MMKLTGYQWILIYTGIWSRQGDPDTCRHFRKGRGYSYRDQIRSGLRSNL